MNEGHTFLYVIFHKGEFYASDFYIGKTSGDYTNKEYLQAMDATLIAAKTTIDVIHERSFTGKLTKSFREYAKKINKVFSASVPEVKEERG